MTLTIWFPAWKDLPRSIDGRNLAEMLCFLFFWGLNVLVIYRGIDTIRFMLNIKAPILIVLGLALLAWAYHAAGGFGPILSQPSQFDPGQPKEGKFWAFFFPGLTAMVSFWATLSLNIPDFSRYARSQRDQVLGQALGLPTTMALYSFIGAAVTSATVVLFGKAIWDPIQLFPQFRNPVVVVVAMVSLCLATLATNIAANVVSPANDFANLWPQRISFRIGGLITGIIGIVILPWRCWRTPPATSSRGSWVTRPFSAPIGGILIADYFLIRRARLDVAELYRRQGKCWYRGGFNPAALVALVAGIAPCVPGFLTAVKLISGSWPWTELYNYAWFLGFGVSFLVYTGLMLGSAGGSMDRSLIRLRRSRQKEIRVIASQDM